MSHSGCRYTVVLQCEASEVLSTRTAKQLHVKISVTICSKISFSHRSISSFWIRFEMYVAFFDALLKWWDNATSPFCTLNAKRTRNFPSILIIALLKCNCSSSRCPRSAIPSLPQRKIFSTIGTNLSWFSSAALWCCSDSWYATSSE